MSSIMNIEESENEWISN